MFPLPRPVGMSEARAGGHGPYAAVLGSAVLAGVFLLFGTFIEFVLAFAGAVRMTRTGAGGQCSDRSILGPTVLTIEFRHKFSVFTCKCIQLFDV